MFIIEICWVFDKYFLNEPQYHLLCCALSPWTLWATWPQPVFLPDNRISLKVSEALIAMLNYQIDYGIDKGLSRISLQGNKLPSHVLESIVSILAEKRKHPAYVPTSNNHRSKSNTSMKTKHLVSEKNRPSSHQWRILTIQICRWFF